MAAVALPNTSCGRCHIAASQLGEPLKRCAGCRTGLYCSKSCQERDWSDHKQQCRALRSGQPAARLCTTMRMTMADLASMRRVDDDNAGGDASSDAPGTFYCLKTSTPHMYDISISGPFESLDAVYAQAIHNFGDACSSGVSALQELRSAGASFQHVSSPIHRDPNRIRRVELIQKTDPDLAVRLPCPIWRIVALEPAHEAMSVTRPGLAGTLPLHNLEVYGTFDNEFEANNAARDLLQDVAGRVDGSSTRITQESPFVAAVFQGQRADIANVTYMVVVEYDDTSAQSGSG